MKTPVAAAPAVDVFGIRTIAARLFEVHRGESGFDHDRLRQLVETTLVGQGTVAEGTLIDEAIRGDGTVSEIGKISGVFGLGGLGAVIGAVGGGVLGVLIGIVFGGMPALNWFRVQPPDWWIFSGAAAIVFTIIVTLIALVAGAILGALVIGGVTVVTSSLWAAKQP